MSYSISELEKRIEKGEGETLDFKFQITSSHKIAVSLVAFANTKGGSLLIGVKDNGSIVGVKTDEEWHMVEAAAKMHSNPPLPIERKIWEIKNKRVLEIIAPESDTVYKAEHEPGKWRSFIRIADENIAINRIIAKTIKKEVTPRSLGSLTAQELNLLGIFKKKVDSFTLNQWIKKSNLTKQRAEHILSNFILWGLIDWQIESNGGISYSVLHN